MTATAKYLIPLLILVAGLYGSASSQPMFSASSEFNNPDCKPPRNRELFHGFIDKQQKAIQESDGRNDNQYTPTYKEEINFLLNQALVKKVDALQCRIENDST